MSEDTALTNRQPNAGAMTTGLGDTSVGAADIQMPRLKLLQALSQAVTDEEAPAGVFWNSLTAENYGRAVTIVPIIGFKNRVYLEQGQGLLCRSLDMVHGTGTPGGDCASCPLKDWPEDRSKGGPKCRESRNWVALVVAAAGEGGKKGEKAPEPTPLDEPQFIVVQFSSMAAGAAKKLNGLYLNARMTNPTANWWDYAFRLVSSQTKNDKGSFYIPDVKPAGRATPEWKEAAKAVLSFLAGKTIDVNVDEEDLNAEPAGAAPAAGGPGF